MKQLIPLILLCFAALSTKAAKLHGKVTTTGCIQATREVFDNVPMPGAIIRAKWTGGIKAAESDHKGRYRIEFPSGVEQLEVSLSMDGFSTQVQVVKVQGRNSIRLNWKFNAGGCSTIIKPHDQLIIDPQSTNTHTAVTRQLAETFGRW